ncbi:MAG: 16S rRNA (guanine(527)-N(7))-methyltransferase RsmG [Candidatus Dependentiae bacterium]|nr:16S rRNA (guanine(527)-N(7))-methyltransferase RsmG [Candidatus Dependentiae bacterium]
MSIAEKFGQNADTLWQTFITKEKLTAVQAGQFERYLEMLQEWNENINLTRIIDIEDIIPYHFQDSMRVAKYVDFSKVRGVCDIGSGAGFPGIPLKILFPDVPFILLEVNNKKVAFLEAVIAELGLTDCTVSPLDWRTFLRQTTHTIDLFVTRASLQLEQLVKVFKPSCHYKDAQLIYWASKKWKPGTQEKAYLVKEQDYTVGTQLREYAFFSGKKA